MFSLRALSSTLIVLLTCGVAVAQHEVGGGSTSGSATSTDSGRGSVKIRRAPARAVAPRRTRPAVRALTAEQYDQQGDTLFEAEQYDDALEAYQKAVQLKPIASAYYHIGWIYNDKDDYAQALTALQQAIRLNPNYAIAYGEIGYSYRNLKRYDEALQAYRRAVTIDPSYARAYYDMGWTFNEKKQYGGMRNPTRSKPLHNWASA